MRLPKDLDCLAESVLKFINIKICDTSEIAQMLHISPDLVQHIKRNLSDAEFIDNNMERITEKGINFFKKTSKAQFSEKKDFGYMLMSLFDGDIMPYFIKGQMPFIGGFPPQTYKLRLPRDEDFTFETIEKANATFTEAYKKYCKIYDDTKDVKTEEELDYLRSEWVDVSFEDVDDESKVTTMDDKLREEEIYNGQVELLNKHGQQMYVLTQLIINKYNPEDIQVLSPFWANITTWYNKKLAYFTQRDNGVGVLDSAGRILPFSDFISEELEEIAFQMPEIQMDNFAYYLRANYPLLDKAPKLKANIELILKEYYSCVQRFKGEGIGGVYVISSGSVFVETLLNNFIMKIRDRSPIVNTKIFGYYTINQAQVDKVFDKFGIKDCWAKRSTAKFLREMSDPRKGWDFPRRVGNSITARYFFLILESFIMGQNPFKKVLTMDAQKVVDILDCIADMRNSNSAHNDKEFYVDIRSMNVDDFIEKNLFITKLMVTILAEEEFENGKKEE
jgi:predicted transcriptional regulator